MNRSELLLPFLFAAAQAGIARAQAIVYETSGLANAKLAYVGRAGDVDADGTGDLLCALGSLPTARVQVRSGSDGSVLYDLLGPGTNAYYGSPFDGGGDLDLDGVPDFLVGLPDQDSLAFTGGEVRAFSGATGALLHSVTRAGPTFSSYGRAVAFAGDVDQDGRADFAASAPDAFVAGVTAGGLVELLSGASGLVLATHGSVQSSADFGQSLRTVGDADGDGIPDLAIGAPYGPGGGGVRVESGATQALLYAVSGTGAPGTLGWTMDSLGDLDGDGVLELAIGDPAAPGGALAFGRVAVVSGRTGAQRFALFGSEPGASFASVLAAAGDVDGDGHGDVVVGAPLSSTPFGAYSGKAHVYSGASGAPLAELFPSDPGETFGRSVAGIGDLNQDGRSDPLVLDPWSAGGSGAAVGVCRGYSLAGCGAVQQQGFGCPGSAGFTPLLHLDACVAPGAIVRLELDLVAGGLPALLLLGSAGAPSALPGGCALLLAPPFAALALPIPPAAPGQGHLSLEGQIPLAASGSAFAAQAIVLDPAGAAGFAASNAVLVAVP